MNRLHPLEVPWSVSPTGSGAELRHRETDVTPSCTVTLGAGFLGDDDKTHQRKVALTFEGCYHARTSPIGDDDGIESVGFQRWEDYEFDPDTYLEERVRKWRESGRCPDPSFYEVRNSAWLSEQGQPTRQDCRHYLIRGRDGIIELLAEGYSWEQSPDAPLA